MKKAHILTQKYVEIVLMFPKIQICYLYMNIIINEPTPGDCRVEAT